MRTIALTAALLAAAGTACAGDNPPDAADVNKTPEIETRATGSTADPDNIPPLILSPHKDRVDINKVEPTVEVEPPYPMDRPSANPVRQLDR